MSTARISKHVSFKEATRSNTAKRLGISNSPDAYQQSNLEILAHNVFEPLRAWVGGPIFISSMFRSEALNSAVSGSIRSQHIEGRAMDIDDIFGYKTNAEMFDYIKNNLEFDTLIWEFGDEDNPSWVHVSYVSEDQNRKRMLRAYKIDGTIQYNIIN